MSDFTIIKRDENGEEILRYTGEVIARGADFVRVNAYFALETRDLGYMILRQGDLFTEEFYSNRWYNVFRVQDVETRHLKGWYCNITRPAIITEDSVTSDDLALDVFVDLSGEVRVLDQDEFDALNLLSEERQAALNAVAHIKNLVSDAAEPFSELETVD